MFDRDAAIANWKSELAQSNAIGADALDEMASHLSDEMDALSRLSLSPEESFLIATRRIGPTRELAQEFAKVQPYGQVFETVRWLATGAIGMVLVTQMFQLILFLSVATAWRISNGHHVPTWVPIATAVAYLAFLTALVALGIKRPRSRFRHFVSSPAVLILFLLLIEGLGALLALTPLHVPFDPESMVPVLITALKREFIPLVALGLGMLAFWAKKRPQPSAL